MRPKLSDVPNDLRCAGEMRIDNKMPNSCTRLALDLPVLHRIKTEEIINEVTMIRFCIKHSYSIL